MLKTQNSVIAGAGIVLLSSAIGLATFDYFDRRAVDVVIDEGLFSSMGSASPADAGAWVPNFVVGTLTLRNTFLFDQIPITAHVITYMASDVDSDVARPDNNLVDSRFRVSNISSSRARIANTDLAENSNIVLIDALSNRTNLIAMYWYDVGGRPTNSRLVARLYAVLNFFYFREDSSVIVLFAECGASCTASEKAIVEFSEKSFLGSDGSYKSIVREVGSR